MFVLPARDKPVAVVIRRGPSRWYQIIRWETDRDRFLDGAWFKGRIYEDRCDVSPDGVLLVYFCHGGRPRPGYTDSWTAVSRVPWLSALALWPSGTTYGGGGRFAGKRELILRNGPSSRAHPDHQPIGLTLIKGPAPRHVANGPIEDADWSGYDFSRRTIFAKDGKLFSRVRGHDRVLADLNGRTPTPQPAPAWAQAPLAKGSGRE